MSNKYAFWTSLLLRMRYCHVSFIFLVINKFFCFTLLFWKLLKLNFEISVLNAMVKGYLSNAFL